MEEYNDPASPAPESSPGPTAFACVPDHELIRLIGRGSYGEVWLARNTLGTFRAVKLVYERTFRHRRPFEREYNGVKKFEPISRLHEGLMDVLQVGRNDKVGYFYCVMELADDVASGQNINPETYSPRTVAQDAVHGRRLPVEECQRIGTAVASALAFLHGHGLIHRDIKPSNIVFVNGVPKLADIGLVAEMSEARSYVGTEGFIPPEGPGTFQSDIYSLGKVLYEISTGMDRHDYPDLPTRLGDPIQEAHVLELNKIILKACRANPEARYKSAAVMAEELRRLSFSSESPLKPTRHERTAAKVVGLAACLGTIVWLLWSSDLRPAPPVSPSTSNAVSASPRKPAASIPVPEGMVAWWRGDGNGSDSGGSNWISQLDDVEFAAGKVGQGFSFDGNPHAMIVSNSPALNFAAGEDFTIEAWIRAEPSVTDIDVMTILDKRVAPTVRQSLGYSLCLAEGKLLFHFSDSLEKAYSQAGGAGPDLRDGRFHHVAVTVQRNSRKGGKLYVDGKLVLPFDPTVHTGSLSNSAPLRFGHNAVAKYNTPFKGIMDEVTLYKRALAEAEISSICKAAGGKHTDRLSSATFEPEVVVSSARGPFRVATGDLDGDGRQDMAVANTYAHAVSLYRNTGSPGVLNVESFDEPETLSIGTGDDDPYELALADLDGDGRADLIVAETRADRVNIFWNRSRPGVLSFAAPVGFATGSMPRGLVVEDFNGDGRPDIVVANFGTNTLSLLKNIGSAGPIDAGFFAARADLTVAGAPHSLAAGDLDRDGKLDLAVASFGESCVSILRNVSRSGKFDAGAFVREADLAMPYSAVSVSLGDVDGDGRLDMLGGTISSPWIRMGDLDGDGKDDFLPPLTNAAVIVYRNVSAPGSLEGGSFSPPVELETAGWVQTIWVRDFTGDGRPEIVFTTQMESRLCVYQNFSKPGAFAAQSLGPRIDLPAGWNAGGLVVDDLDGDGHLDCVFANFYSGTLSLYRNTGLCRSER